MFDLRLAAKAFFRALQSFGKLQSGILVASCVSTCGQSIFGAVFRPSLQVSLRSGTSTIMLRPLRAPRQYSAFFQAK